MNSTTNQITACEPEDCSSCTADCSSRMNLNDKVIEITTDEGETMRCLVALKYQMEQQDYIAVMPLKDNPEGDIYLFRMISDGTKLDNIEDPDEYNRAAEAFGIAMEKEQKKKYE